VRWNGAITARYVRPSRLWQCTTVTTTSSRPPAAPVRSRLATRALTWVRDAVMATVGVKSSRAIGAAAAARGSVIGYFPLLSKSAGELVVGEDDRHLDFRVPPRLPLEQDALPRPVGGPNIRALIKSDNVLRAGIALPNVQLGLGARRCFFSRFAVSHGKPPIRARPHHADGPRDPGAAAWPRIS
jgi:Protein of unknown function (DUF2867)